MSSGILAKVKEFLVRLIKDHTFRSHLENSSVEERNRFLEASGYQFTKEEFETAAIAILESKERGEFEDLSEAELASVFGGYGGITPIKPPIVQPMYGVIWWPVPIYPPVQPMYGVIVDTTL
jgi:predicted ribosomally synthesized peptide with nif11-like leader